MREAVDDVIQRRRVNPRGLGRVMGASVAIHFATVAVLFAVPKDWLVKDQPQPILMTISLGGSAGERSGGRVSAGARPVEQVAPQPKRAEPIPPATPPKANVIAVPAKTPAKTPPKPTDSTTPSTLTRPPTTGARVARGTSVAETGATGQGTGLQSGGGAGGAQAMVDVDFCCKDYLTEVVRRIEAKWQRLQPEAGTTIIVFEILRDGTITKREFEQRSSVPLDIASMAAFQGVRLPPLPPEYREDRLKVHLSFPYVR